MVKDEIVTKYKCPYCDKAYDTVEIAEDCAEDCIDIEPPVEITESIYICEICNEKYDKYFKADDCEQQHMENNDRKYLEYLDKEEKAKLRKAGEHKEQMRLKKWWKENENL